MFNNLVNIFLKTLVILTISASWAIEFPECENVSEPDTFVASYRSCSKYVFCSDEELSFEGECLGGNYFNQVQGICDDPENVDCDIVPGEDVSSIFDDKFQKSDIENEEGNENDNGSDDDDEVVEEVMDSGENDDDEGEEEITDNSNAQDHEAVTIYEVPEAIRCSRLSSNTVRHIPHRESCSAFFTCYNGMVIPMLCPRNLFFNPATEKCEPQMPINCKQRYSVRLNCRKGVYDYMPHPSKCEYYYYCLNGFLMILRCPYDFVWHYERRTCVHKSLAKCYTESSIVMGLQQQLPVVYRSPNQAVKYM
ncbi:uncharacterized protein [Musca autumnalis]|uniref:uncharacterized protein n=1 Tax=Musca autumnalis TaxID=221902 RepID=UPI003CEB4D3A